MKNILVVDDDVDILELVKMTLGRYEFIVKAISRWEEIDDNIELLRPDLILLDVTLIGADGRSICKRIKQKKETQNIPVILFSANTHSQNIVQECEAQAFIEKPYELSHLLKTIRTYVL
jgi:DNA-binding response OmpR family regulator